MAIGSPRRIVSLCPSVTETLVAIGGYRRLVGVTRFCVRPAGMLWGLPRVGGTKNPDVARIVDLAPDLVFANEEENRMEDVRALESAGIEVDVSFPRTVADVPPAIRRWGRRLGEEGEAEALAARIEEKLEAIGEASARRPFLYAYWIWKDPWMTVSDDTYVADLLRLAGGISAYGREPARYPTASPADALRRGVDVHFFPSEPYPFREDRHAAELERLFGAGGLRRFVAGDDYCWHGVRTLDGLRRMEELREEIGQGG
jgi:ABC-type Fe3+-hydroxamate transport system substrate-binding protein